MKVEWNRMGSVKWKVFRAEINGLTPLLMHNPAQMRDTDGSSRKRVPTPEQEAELGLYRNPDGVVSLRADHVRQALLNAARVAGLRIQKRPAAPRLAASLMTPQEWFPLFRNGEPITDYDRIDVRRVVVQRRGILRARPVINVPWRAEVLFTFDCVTVNAQQIAEALEVAGLLVGLLDYRPEKGGTFGRFTVGNVWEEE